MTILVIGDVMVDRYVDGRIRRVAAEAPIPVFERIGQRDYPGGAANVAANIAALGQRAVVIAADPADGGLMTLIFKHCFEDLPVEFRLVGVAGHGTRKTRYVVDGQMVFRLDEDHPADVEVPAGEIISAADAVVRNVSAIIISDYAKGVISEKVALWTVRAARDRGIPVIVDPKPPRLMDAWEGATIIKMNEHEAAVPMAFVPMCGAQWVLVTKGAAGMTLHGEGETIHIAACVREVFDVVGAGDTVAAALAVGLSRGWDMLRSARFANAAAGVVVGKHGTATATMAEVEAALSASG